ncbi:MAG: hypothetical protein JWM76_2288 [Pseudonocardiales bacterium]|nr:hypothetical protein [Pseudonocardiales bacterium]
MPQVAARVSRPQSAEIRHPSATSLEVRYVTAVTVASVVAVVGDHLGVYVAAVVRVLPVGVVLPMALFLVSGLVAFATGTGFDSAWRNAPLIIIGFAGAAVVNLSVARLVVQAAEPCLRPLETTVSSK